MARNFEALRALRDKIMFEPEHHDQTDWGQLGENSVSTPITITGTKDYQGNQMVMVSCPSSACAAGHAVINHGDNMLFRREDVVDGYGTAFRCVDKQGRVHEIMQRARNLLGLTEAQANHLFDGDHSTGETIEMIDVLLKDDLDARAVTAELRVLYKKFEDERCS